MKLTVFLTLLACMEAGASALAQRVTLNVKNASLIEVFNEIRKQSDVDFVYRSAQIKQAKAIDIQVSQTPLEEVLALIFDDQPLEYVLDDKTIIVRSLPQKSKANKEKPKTIAHAQQTVQGRVTTLDNKPLAGVSVLRKGTPSGVTTNSDGGFNLTANLGDVLVFKYLGYLSQEIEITNFSALSIKLQEDATLLNEVVLTGYATQAKKDITGSVVVVDVKELNKVSAPNLAQQLQGRAAGVTVTSNNTPGGEATVRVRGFGTINNNDPLYIIDGVPTKGGLNSINPNNIESMQVLKDASATSIYGSRAANGVVIITTKKGSSGESRITFDSRTGIQTGHINLGLIKDPLQFGELLWEQRRNAGLLTNGNPSHQQYGNGANPVVPDYILAGSSYGLFEGDPRVDPSLYSYDADNFYQIVQANKEGTGWHDEILRNALFHDYNLGATGGSENGRYAVSLNYLNQEGVLDHTSFNRYSLRTNTEFNVKKIVRFGENLEVSYTENKGYYYNNGTESGTNNQDGNPIGNGYRIPSIIPVYDIMGNFAATRAAGLGPATNPVAQLYRTKDNQANTLRAFGNVFAEVDVIKDLTFRTSLGFDYTNLNRVNYVLMDLEEAEIEAANSMTKANINDINLTWSNTLNYNKVFNEVHSLNVLAGTEAIKAFGEDFSGSRATYFSEEPTFMFLSSGTANINNAGAGYEWSLFSIFGKVNYSLQGKYLLEATIRRDGSSRFGINNRYGTFPAFSGGWRISQESFMQHLNWLDNLLIRAGWGQTGNQEIGNYNGMNTYRSALNQSSYAIDGSNNSILPGFDTGAFGNPDAKWETTTQTNIGLDLAILQGKLGFNLDLYNRTTSDMLYQVALPATQGVATIPYVNVGEMNNKGFDFAVNFQDKSNGGAFSYGISANISAYRNEVVQLSDSETAILLGPTIRSYVWTRSTAGQPLYSFYGHVIDGIYQNEQDLANGSAYPGYAAVGKYKYRDLDDDGVITDNDRTFIGNPHPDFTYGLTLNMGYKNFDFSAFFQGVQGNDVLNMVKRWTDFNQQAGNRSLRMLNDSWTPGNPDAVLPILDANDSRSQQPSSYYIENGSYLRLKNVTLGYSLPQSTLARIGLQSARIYISGQNLFTITDYSGIDPEITQVGSTPGSTTLGVDQGNYPLSKIYQLGINIGF